MKIRKVGIPRLTADNLRDVVARIVEAIDELQGAVGSPDQRAVRLGELLRARIARVDPRGELLLQDSAATGTSGTGGDVAITGQAGRITVQQAGQAFVLDLATVPATVGGALVAITTDTFGRIVAARPVTAGANVTIAPAPDGQSIVISAAAGSATSYTHSQPTAAVEWTINHNLGFRPAIELFNLGGAEIIGEVVHIDINQAKAYFSLPVAGSARCN